MNNDNHKENKPGGISEDPDLVLLDRILKKAGGVVFPPPSDIPEATDEEVSRLMKLTADVRVSRQKPRARILLFPARSLALAASVLILAGLFFSTMQGGKQNITIAMAMPQSSLVFRGGEIANELPDAIESGIRSVLNEQSKKTATTFVQLDNPLSENETGKTIISLIAPSGSRNILYVTEDTKTGELVMVVYEHKTGRKLAEKRLESGDASQMQKNVSSVVSGWVRDCLL